MATAGGSISPVRFASRCTWPSLILIQPFLAPMLGQMAADRRRRGRWNRRSGTLLTCHWTGMLSRPSMGHIHDFGNLPGDISGNSDAHSFVFASHYLYDLSLLACCSHEPIQVLYPPATADITIEPPIAVVLICGSLRHMRKSGLSKVGFPCFRAINNSICVNAVNKSVQLLNSTRHIGTLKARNSSYTLP